MFVGATFTHNSEKSGRGVLKKIYQPKAGHAVIVVDKSGTRTAHSIDFNVIVPKVYDPGEDDTDPIRRINKRPIGSTEVDRIETQTYVTTPTFSLDLRTPDNATYPLYQYKADGETDTPESTLVVPTWVTVETPTQRATRIKNHYLGDWRKRLNKLAEDFIDESAQIDIWVKRNAFRGHTSPKFHQSLDVNSNFHAQELEAGDNAGWHRAKLIGIANRLVDLYDDANNGDPMIWPQCPLWRQTNDYKTGDYSRHSNNRVWIALKNHRSSSSNAPGETGGVTFWKQAKMNTVPTTIVKADNTSVTINTVSGAGIDEFIGELEAEFKAFNAYDFYRHARVNRSTWTGYHNNQELHFMDATSKVSRLKVYDATVAAVNSSDSNQRDGARVHSEQNWTALHDIDFLAAYNYVAPAS